MIPIKVKGTKALVFRSALEESEFSNSLGLNDLETFKRESHVTSPTP